MSSYLYDTLRPALTIYCSTYFKFRTEPNREKAREIEAKIDPKYSASHTTVWNARGGTTEGFDPVKWQTWVRTIKDKPAKLRARFVKTFLVDAIQDCFC